MTTFSLVIPYKNAQEYVKTCLDSFIAQTYSDFEIICVDDGSEDSSYNIIDSYAQKDGRIKNYKSENRGPGCARNKGVECAQGKYIIFADADDYAAPELLQTLYNAYSLHECDSVWYNYYEQSDKGINKVEEVAEGYLTITPDNIIRYTEYLWIKSFSTDFLKRNKIKFLENVLLGDDDYFYYSVAFSNPKIYCIEDALYYYKRNTKSITGNISRVFLRNRDFLKVIYEIYKQVILNNYDNGYKTSLRTQAALYTAQYRGAVNPFLNIEYKKFLHNVEKLENGIEE